MGRLKSGEGKKTASPRAPTLAVKPDNVAPEAKLTGKII